jgi:hypothetical protein
MGGEYVDNNVISVEVTNCDGRTANHVMWHYANWQLWGKEEDRFAWRGLAGYYSKEEIIRERMRISGRKAGLRNIGRKLSNNHKDAIRRGHLGKKHTQKTKDLMSKSHIGQPSPQRGKPRTPEEKQKISNTLSGSKKSIPHRQKISETLKGMNIGKSWWVNEKNEVKFRFECPGPGWVNGRKYKG